MLHIKNDAFIGKIFIDWVIEPETVGIRLTLFDTWYEIRCTGELGEEFAGELYDWDHEGNSREPGKEFIRSGEYDILENGEQAGSFALIEVQMSPASIRPYYEMEYYGKKEHRGILLYYIYSSCYGVGSFILHLSQWPDRTGDKKRKCLSHLWY